MSPWAFLMVLEPESWMVLSLSCSSLFLGMAGITTVLTMSTILSGWVPPCPRCPTSRLWTCTCGSAPVCLLVGHWVCSCELPHHGGRAELDSRRPGRSPCFSLLDPFWNVKKAILIPRLSLAVLQPLYEVRVTAGGLTKLMTNNLKLSTLLLLCASWFPWHPKEVLPGGFLYEELLTVCSPPLTLTWKRKGLMYKSILSCRWMMMMVNACVC